MSQLEKLQKMIKDEGYSGSVTGWVRDSAVILSAIYQEAAVNEEFRDEFVGRAMMEHMSWAEDVMNAISDQLEDELDD